jgi:hypothetical protein
MTGLETIIILNSVVVVANTFIIFVATNKLSKVINDA